MTEFLRPLLYQAKSLPMTPYTLRLYMLYRKGMMCSCGSPDDGPGKSSATKSCLYVRQEVIAEDKEANDYS